MAAASGASAVSASRVHELRTTACSYDVAANASGAGGSTYGGSHGADARRLLLSSSVDGEVRVSAAASGVERWRWPLDGDDVAKAIGHEHATVGEFASCVPRHVALSRDGQRALIGCERYTAIRATRIFF